MTGLARFPAGLALFAIGSKGFAVGLIHLHIGLAQPLAAVWSVAAVWSAAVCLPLSLVFLMPSLARRVLHAGRHPDTTVWLGVAAAVVLFILTVASTAFALRPTDPVFGLVPRWWLALDNPIYAFIFALAFIYPGVAYPPPHLHQHSPKTPKRKQTTLRHRFSAA